SQHSAPQPGPGREVLAAGSEVMCQEEKLAGLGTGLSPAAGMKLPFHRLRVRGVRTSTAGAGWGLPGSPHGDTHGDTHRAAAFLDKTPGKQAAVQILTSEAWCPGVHLLTAQSSH
uniref:Uncharacterized protein n=1 Tax=Malurus cyaneus samueli TaxID=2593467 RepID=A0A8C5TDE8_9PASS